MKKTMGKRRRIDVEIGEKPMNRQVCFSKRRQGLFKKASEICMLTGSQIAIITFSPSGKPFVLGHPSVHPVVDRFLQNDDEINVHATTTSDDHHARARLVAQEIEGREILLKKEKDKRQCVGECDVSDLECDYDLWFEIDQESRSDLEKLETLHYEWMQARKKIVEKLGTASSSTSSIMASSSDYNGIVNKCSASSSLGDPFAGLCHTPESFHVDPLSEVVDNFLLHNSSHGDDENYWDLDELNLDWDFLF